MPAKTRHEVVNLDHGRVTVECPRLMRSSCPSVAKIDARDFSAIARHDGFENALPAIGAVNVAGTKCAAFQIAELIEQEQRMIAGAVVVPVPDAVLLLAMGRADAGVHVERHPLR
jgi:hypothetical protein